MIVLGEDGDLHIGIEKMTCWVCDCTREVAVRVLTDREALQWPEVRFCRTCFPEEP